jgi:hypothetical protein
VLVNAPFLGISGSGFDSSSIEVPSIEQLLFWSPCWPKGNFI